MRKITRNTTQRGSGMLDFLVGASLLLIPVGIFISTTVVVQKQAILTKDLMDMSSVAERTAKMLADGRFSGATSGTIYITREGITFKPADPSKAEAVGFFDRFAVTKKKVDQVLPSGFQPLGSVPEMVSADEHFTGDGGGEVRGECLTRHREDLLSRSSAFVVNRLQVFLGQSGGDEQVGGDTGLDNGRQAMLTVPESILSVEGDALMGGAEFARQKQPREFHDIGAVEGWLLWLASSRPQTSA